MTTSQEADEIRLARTIRDEENALWDTLKDSHPWDEERVDSALNHLMDRGVVFEPVLGVFCLTPAGESWLEYKEDELG